MDRIARLFKDFRASLCEYKDGLPWIDGPEDGIDMPVNETYLDVMPEKLHRGQKPRMIPGGPGQYVPDIRQELPRDSRDLQGQLDRRIEAIRNCAIQLDKAICRHGLSRKLKPEEMRGIRRASKAEKDQLYSECCTLHGWAVRAETMVLELRPDVSTVVSNGDPKKRELTSEELDTISRLCTAVRQSPDQYAVTVKWLRNEHGPEAFERRNAKRNAEDRGGWAWHWMHCLDEARKELPIRQTAVMSERDARRVALITAIVYDPDIELMSLGWPRDLRPEWGSDDFMKHREYYQYRRYLTEPTSGFRGGFWQHMTEGCWPQLAKRASDLLFSNKHVNGPSSAIQSQFENADRPNDLVRTAVALDQFHVSRSTLKRAVRDGKLTDYRPINHPPNASYLLSESELSKKYQRRQ